MKFVLFVEGYAEKMVGPSFLKRWLDPKLREPVGIRIVRHDGWAEYVKDIRKKVGLHLSGPGAGDVIACIGLLDLYGPTFYPPNVTGANERWNWAKGHLESVVGSPRFSQHFAVHELEAWILAEPDNLPPYVKRALPPRAAQPEAVNFDEPPGKLLERLYREKLKRHYKKTTDGTTLFQRLDPAQVYSRCPYFKRLADELLSLARSAGL